MTHTILDIISKFIETIAPFAVVILVLVILGKRDGDGIGTFDPNPASFDQSDYNFSSAYRRGDLDQLSTEDLRKAERHLDSDMLSFNADIAEMHRAAEIELRRREEEQRREEE